MTSVTALMFKCYVTSILVNSQRFCVYLFTKIHKRQKEKKNTHGLQPLLATQLLLCLDASPLNEAVFI